MDYPDYTDKLAAGLKEVPEAIGILICGSGNGIKTAHQTVTAFLTPDFGVGRISAA